VKNDAELSCSAFNLKISKVHTASTLLKEGTNCLVNGDILAVGLLVCSKPTALPVTDDAKAMCVRVDGVCHVIWCR
jgi:hypothetical protein